MTAITMRPGAARQRGGFALGLVVGLLVGLAVALAVALYITKAPVPFVNKVPQRSAEQDAAEAEKNRHWDPNAPLAGKSAMKPAAPASAAPPASGTATGAVATAPLPASGVVSGAAAPAQSPAPAAARASAADPAHAPRDPAAILAGQVPPEPRAEAKPPAAPLFFVQAGAYARTDDAEAQRAKVGMLGLSAKVMEREQAGRTVYRVRLGPFNTREEAEAVQAKLGESSIEASLVRVER